MPRSLWNGTISVGLIHVPVKLYSATEPKTVRFREVHLPDEGKIEHRRFCSAEEKEVPYEEVVRGFEVADGEYVVLEPEELAAAAGDRGKVVDVEAFVPDGSIDPVFYAKTYHLGPGATGADAYRLLRAALERTQRVGLGRFTFHNREHLAAIRPREGVLALHTMRFADELVPGSAIEAKRPDRAPTKQEVAMAARLVESLHEPFAPHKRKDRYRKAVLEMIERKGTGKKPRKPREKPPEETPDLMAALEASL